MALKVHIGFELPEDRGAGSHVVSHFSKLGYRLIEERPGEWIFQRGKKISALWRFDIRAYHTTLTVRLAAQRDGGIFISCDWEVYTFMSITTGADVATLEAEGRELESVLRGAA